MIVWSEADFIEQLLPKIKAGVEAGRDVCPHLTVLATIGEAATPSALVEHLGQCSQCSEVYVRLIAFIKETQQEDTAVNRTHYEILEVSRVATPEQIKESYRILAGVWHPDRFQAGTPSYERATERLKRINAAYAVLKDRAKRASYDQLLSNDNHAKSEHVGFSQAQERTIESNRKRYLAALGSAEMRHFCRTAKLEDARLLAVADLEKHQLDRAKELLLRFTTEHRRLG